MVDGAINVLWLLEVSLVCHRYQMNMGMWHTISRHYCANPWLRDAIAHVSSKFTGNTPEVSVRFLVKIPQMIDLLFGNYQCMTLDLWVNVEKRDYCRIFVYLVARDFALDDFGKYRILHMFIVPPLVLML